MFPVKFTMGKWGFAAGMFAELCMVDFQWLRLRAHFIERIKVKSCWQWGTVSWLLIKLFSFFCIAQIFSLPSSWIKMINLAPDTYMNCEIFSLHGTLLYVPGNFEPFKRDEKKNSSMRVCASKSQWRKLRKNARFCQDQNRITESMHTTSPRKEERLEATDPFCSSQFAEYNEHWTQHACAPTSCSMC